MLLGQASLALIVVSLVVRSINLLASSQHTHRLVVLHLQTFLQSPLSFISSLSRSSALGRITHTICLDLTQGGPDTADEGAA